MANWNYGRWLSCKICCRFGDTHTVIMNSGQLDADRMRLCWVRIWFVVSLGLSVATIGDWHATCVCMSGVAILIKLWLQLFIFVLWQMPSLALHSVPGFFMFGVEHLVLSLCELLVLRWMLLRYRDWLGCGRMKEKVDLSLCQWLP